MGYAKVTLLGNLTRDPETRFSQGGHAFTSFGMAVNRKMANDKNGNQREEVVFIDVTIIGKRGEAFARYHRKGSQAFLVGDLTLDQWEDKQTGEKKSRHKVTAWEWEFVGGKAGGGQAGGATESSTAGLGWTQDQIDDTPF